MNFHTQNHILFFHFLLFHKCFLLLVRLLLNNLLQSLFHKNYINNYILNHVREVILAVVCPVVFEHIVSFSKITVLKPSFAK
mgnify:FL=1